MIQSNEIVHIGTITRTHGQGGEVQCHLTNDYWLDNEAQFIILSIDGIFVPFRVNEWREKGEDILLLLQGIDSESKARQLTGCEASMLRRDITSDNSDTSLTYPDLIGWTIVTPTKRQTIVDVDESTINTLALLDDGSMLPLHEDLIEAIDEEQQIIQLNIAY